MENPFSGLTYTKKERKTIPAGVYQAELTQIKKYTYTDKKDNEQKTKILFIFKVPTTDSDLTTGYFPSLKNNSKFYGWVNMLTSGTIPESGWASYEALWKHLSAVVNTTFTLQVTVNGEYNNILAAMPAVLPKAPVQKAAPDMPVSEEDDIPF